MIIFTSVLRLLSTQIFMLTREKPELTFQGLFARGHRPGSRVRAILFRLLGMVRDIEHQPGITEAQWQDVTVVGRLTCSVQGRI